MAKKIYFTPGPSALYFTAEEHIKQALRLQIPEISHRSGDFKTIFEKASNHIRTLLDVPASHHIAFVSSATEIWERLIENLVEKNSLHLVNGAFSKRFFEMAAELGRQPESITAGPGSIPDTHSIVAGNQPELVAITQNETSTGVHFPDVYIKQLRQAYPQALFSLDVVSSTPIMPIDFQLIDSAYFSVQKCFGLPAGLGVWIYNDQCLAKAEKLSEKISIGTYHNLLKVHESAQKFQTPETPNVLNIYLLAKVAEDMLTKGLDMIRREANYKAALLYQCYESHPLLQSFVQNKEIRSKTVAVAEVNGGSESLRNLLAGKGLVVGSGYGSFKNEHIRIANFPTHSKEQVEMLVDEIAKFG